MVLQTIYIVRHGFHLNWEVDAEGNYRSSMPTPTGIPNDPVLAKHGVGQSEELARHLLSVQPPVDLIYSSPWYRCIQTLQPFARELSKRRQPTPVKINLEAGVGEFFGKARFDHPPAAPVAELQDLFPNLQAEKQYIILPSGNGETIPGLHDRVAYALNELIKRADADPTGPKSLLICTHAAVMIAIGRLLTGRMPADESEEDFACYTCSFSRYQRRHMQQRAVEVRPWSPTQPEHIPDVQWRGGNGVAGGWDCEVNGDCSFLTGGAERGWRFFGDESFLKDPNAFNDIKNQAKENAKL